MISQCVSPCFPVLAWVLWNKSTSFYDGVSSDTTKSGFTFFACLLSYAQSCVFLSTLLFLSVSLERLAMMIVFKTPVSGGVLNSTHPFTRVSFDRCLSSFLLEWNLGAFRLVAVPHAVTRGFILFQNGPKHHFPVCLVIHKKAN